jgi:hypothetical protein
VVLLLQDRWWEGTFTCTLLPSDNAIDFCTILDNMTMKDYFSMLKISVMPQCPAGLLIRVQPNTYLEKTEHFRTALHLVKERGQLNKGYNMQELKNCVVSGLCKQQTALGGLPFKPVHHQGTYEVPDKAISPEDLFCLQQGSPPHSRRVAVRN